MTRLSDEEQTLALSRGDVSDATDDVTLFLILEEEQGKMNIKGFLWVAVVLLALTVPGAVMGQTFEGGTESSIGLQFSAASYSIR